MVSYEQWESQTVDKPGRTKTAEHTSERRGTKKVVVKAKKSAKLKDFKVILKDGIASFVQHVFRWRWQAERFKEMATVLNKHRDHVAIAMDFSENYTVLEPTEVQSAYFNNKQISILVFIVYRASNNATDGNVSGTDQSQSAVGSSTTSSDLPAGMESVDMEQYFFLSDDTRKGCQFVHHCIMELIKHWEQNNRRVSHIHFWSDGCAGDFKSNHSMWDRALIPHLTTPKAGQDGKNVTCHVNFFESGHGKGPWDAAGGWLKNLLARRAVQTKSVLGTAAEIAELINEHYSRPSTDYNRQRKLVSRTAFAIPCSGTDAVQYELTSRAGYCLRGIMNMRQMACMGGGVRGVSDMVVHNRSLSCYCSKCMDFNTNTDYHTECENREVVEAYKAVQMLPADSTTKLVKKTLEEEEEDELAEFGVALVEDIVKPGAGLAPSTSDKDCYVAIFHDDADYRESYAYYVMYVTTGPTVLKKAWTDDKGSKFSKGSKILKGFYFELAPCPDDPECKLPQEAGTYVLESGIAGAHVEAVLHVGFPMTIDDTTTPTRYIMNEGTREDIINILRNRNVLTV